jgi:predicted alpha-1,2-mannosidase
MIGNHAVSLIADAVTKGFECFSASTAWAALYKSATEDNTEHQMRGMCGYLNLGTPPEYIENGFVSTECDGDQSVSMTLEYAYDDWAIAQTARVFNRPDLAGTFDERALNYQHHWDASVGFMRAKHRDGSWVEPFDPAGGDDFCEASSWIYTWYVPHDVAGLITLMGGDAAFVAKLDQFFAEDHFEISNEPSFHAPFLYNYAGAPAKTQERVRAVIASDFSEAPDGLPGNDDAGATSAWLVLSSIGLFPMAPGDGIYTIASPLFDRVTLELNPLFAVGGTFVIETVNNSASNFYVQSATLNGQPLLVPQLQHEQLIAGGTLTLQMGPNPSAWGQ